MKRRGSEVWLEAHLATREVSHVLYGTIVGLALVLAFEHDSHYPPEKIAALVVGTAVGISLATLFSEAISIEARKRAALSRDDRVELARETAAEFIGCSFPALFFVLASLDVLEERTAFRLAKWSGLTLVVGYAYLASRLSGDTKRRSARHALIAACIGFLVVQLKSLLH